MTASDYYKILGLSPDCSVNEIKKSYRAKARLYHPDINHTSEAKDKFIEATEAYEFLVANFGKIQNQEEAYNQAMEDWRKYRQSSAKRRARAYAHTSYTRFSNTKFYRSTRIMDATTIIFGLVVSVMMIVVTIFGYIYRLKHPLPEPPPVSPFVSFIMLLSLGVLFFTLSTVYLKVHIQSSKKKKKKSTQVA
jgi:hypothetical protein